jgi:hypothetical protein
MKILNIFRSIVDTAISAGIIGLIYQHFKDRKDSLIRANAILKRLYKDSKFNLRHRGDSMCPFNRNSLEHALSNPDFLQHYPDLIDQCSELDNLMLDSNFGTLGRRKRENGTSLVPSDVQHLVEELMNTIKNKLPNAE